MELCLREFHSSKQGSTLRGLFETSPTPLFKAGLPLFERGESLRLRGGRVFDQEGGESSIKRGKSLRPRGGRVFDQTTSNPLPPIYQINPPLDLEALLGLCECSPSPQSASAVVSRAVASPREVFSLSPTMAPRILAKRGESLRPRVHSTRTLSPVSKSPQRLEPCLEDCSSSSSKSPRCNNFPTTEKE
jgi:hypothetical protein